jgi:acyl-homoserine lactone acylase PvdQ
LRTQESEQIQLNRLIDDAYSTWAAQTAPYLIGLLAPGLPDEAPLRDAHTYLRNWDFSYDEASIAASIFDTWLATYRSAYGQLPDVVQDSVIATPPRYVQTFRASIDSLTARYGADQSQWRWESVRPERRLFPIWSVDTLRQAYPRVITNTRYAPIALPGRGHPSSLAWGSSPIQPGLPAPSAWEAWISTAAWDRFTVRRRRLDANAPLGRYLISDRPPDPLVFPRPTASPDRTLLTPRRPAS